MENSFLKTAQKQRRVNKMWFKKIWMAITILTLLFFVVSCGKSGGDKFLGEWGIVNDARPANLKITKMGEKYFVDDMGENEVGKVPCSYKEGCLESDRAIVVLCFDDSGLLILHMGGMDSKYKKK
jgi:hypothetical protein